MCGIVGIISRGIIKDEYREIVLKMEKNIFHRGPDSNGRYLDTQVYLAMRRLSIIDLDSGFQPLYNEDKSIVLIANGEIYNYKELTTKLIDLGHKFRTKSDCETIIHLYEEYGESFVSHLRGMFAFALYDIKKNTVYIVRDRMGEKPLYYFQTDSHLLFSSELKALMSSGLIQFDLDPENIYDYFHYQYIPEPATPFKNVHKLESGSLFKIELKHWNIKKVKYWDILDSSPVDGNPVELITKELESISEIIIRSDVNIGVALSGGLDSSAITALAHKYYPGKLVAFSVGYPGYPENDERRDALKLTQKLGVPMIEVELDENDLVQNFAEMNFFRDDPIADISGFGYYAVNRAAKNHSIRVLLQGQGSDELFWGYEWVKNSVIKTNLSLNRKKILSNFYREWKKNFPKWNLADIKKWVLSITRIRGSYKSIEKFSNPIDRAIFYDLTPDFLEARKSLSDLLNQKFLEKINVDIPYRHFPILKDVPVDIMITKFICDTYLAENGVSQGDRLSMAFGVELRLPFLDYKLVELIIGLRKANQKNPDFLEFPKPWLRKAMKGILEDEVISRPKKGFSPPTHLWHNKLFEQYGQELINGILVEKEILSEEGAKKLSTGPFPVGTVSPLSFKALVLENWLRGFQTNISI